jgi:hypothetical protein
MRLDGYNQCKDSKKAPKREKTPKSSYDAQFRQYKDTTFYNNRGNSCYNSRSKWYDSGKTDLLKNLKGTQGYSQERKLLDLASSQVFEGLTVNPDYQLQRQRG